MSKTMWLVILIGFSVMAVLMQCDKRDSEAEPKLPRYRTTLIDCEGDTIKVWYSLWTEDKWSGAVRLGPGWGRDTLIAGGIVVVEPIN